MAKVWYSYSGETYDGNFPNYFNPMDFSWTQPMLENHVDLKKRCFSFIKENAHLFENYQSKEINPNKKWKVIPFMFWGKTKRSYDFLDVYLKNIEGLLSVGISCLKAQSEIPQHIGDCSAIIRCHIDIFSPKEAFFEVNEEKKYWLDEKVILFCDAHAHRAVNASGQDRYVLILDVLHPEFKSQEKLIKKNVLSYLKLQKIQEKYTVLKKLPPSGRGLVRKTIRLFV